MSKSLIKFEFWLNNLIVGLAVLILLIVVIGDRGFPHVIGTNLPDKINPAEQKFIKIDFSRLMDRKSVEDNFSMTPELPGKFSWSGKTLVFTPDESLEYGQNYLLKIAGEARSQDGKSFVDAFEKKLKIEDLRLGYLSTNGSGKGNLVFSGLNGKTSKSFNVEEKISQFLISPDKQWIYYLGQKLNENVELYRININDSNVEQLTKDKNFQNKKFILSDDGKQLALSRIKLSNSGELLSRIEVWLSSTDKFDLQRFRDGNAQGMDISFSPKGMYLLYRNPDSNFELAKVSLTEGEKDEALYIGEYASSFGFHPYLPNIAFAEYDQQDVFSLNNNLMLFSGDGEKKNLNFPKGVIRDFKFSQNGKFAIVLFSGENDNLTTKYSLSESKIFHLYRYDFADGKITPITNDNDYSEQNPQLSADSRYLLMERVLATDENLLDPAFQNIQNNLEGEVAGHQLWLMDLKTGSLKDLKIEAAGAVFLP